MVECCGKAQGMAEIIANKVNMNQYHEPIDEGIAKDYVGPEKCQSLPVDTTAKGKENCKYAFSRLGTFKFQVTSDNKYSDKLSLNYINTIF